jgi:hypothetical protein
MNDTLERDVTTEETVIPDLTLADNCDAFCPASAFVRVEVREGTYLDLCAHHYAESEVALVARGYRVLDRRGRLS